MSRGLIPYLLLFKAPFLDKNLRLAMGDWERDGEKGNGGTTLNGGYRYGSDPR